MSQKIEVGQKLFFEPVNHRGGRGEIQETHVTSVGRKYFTVAGERSRFFIDGLHNDTQASAWRLQLYRTREEIEERNEVIRLARELSQVFSYGAKGVGLDKLRQVAQIVGITP